MRRFLSANYSPDECAAIVDRLVCPARRRSVTICHECQQYVGEDATLILSGGDMRLCDYVVDPVCCSQGPGGRDVAHVVGHGVEGVVRSGRIRDMTHRLRDLAIPIIIVNGGVLP